MFKIDRKIVYARALFVIVKRIKQLTLSNYTRLRDYRISERISYQKLQ